MPPEEDHAASTAAGMAAASQAREAAIKEAQAAATRVKEAAMGAAVSNTDGVPGSAPCPWLFPFPRSGEVE